MNWKKGRVFKKGRKSVRYIYPNGKKRGKKLVSAKGKGRFYKRPRYSTRSRRRY